MKNSGTLEVMLVEGSGLINTDLIGKSDPYAIISCGTEERRSCTIHEGGENPKWNEIFEFAVDENVSELNIKIFDEDLFRNDDALGSVTIPLDKVIEHGRLPPVNYQVLRHAGHAHGEIKVGLKFVPEKPQ